MARRNWSDEEVRHALALYLRLDFGKFHSRNPQVIELSQRIGRTASAVAMKLSNLAALDQSLPQKGMANASATDRRVWAEFLSAPEWVLAAYQSQTSDPIISSFKIEGFAERRAAYETRQDQTATVHRIARIGQSFFRDMILTSYRSRCALTGNEDSRLLTASHIVGWAEDPTQRLNPSNGICLNALHDRAFDKHLITFDENYRMCIAPDVPSEARRALKRVRTDTLELPERFLPDQALLEVHRQRYTTRLT